MKGACKKHSMGKYNTLHWLLWTEFELLSNNIITLFPSGKSSSHIFQLLFSISCTSLSVYTCLDKLYRRKYQKSKISKNLLAFQLFYCPQLVFDPAKELSQKHYCPKLLIHTPLNIYKMLELLTATSFTVLMGDLIYSVNSSFKGE